MKLILTPLILLLSSFASNSQVYRGCFFKTANAHTGSISTKYNRINFTAADPLYNVVVQEIQRIQNCLGVFPIFYFYDDVNENNAMATDEVTHQNGPDGTVIFGKRLFNREYIKSYGGTTIPIIMAHEYAHIVDYKYGVLQNVGSKKTELFADYIAGFYMYHRVANNISTDVAQCIRSFESLGDTDFGNKNEHGTPYERRTALVAGYNKALQIHQIQTWISLTEIIEKGKEYISGIADTEDEVIIIK
jgi:hypothetical protein